MMKRVLLLTLAVFITVFSFAQDAADKINQANEALQAKDYEKAFNLYDEAMGNLGDVQVDESINFNVGFAAYKAGNMDGALKYLDKAIEVGANVSRSHGYKALIYSDKEEYEKAVASFEKAIETAEEVDESLYYKAGIAAYQGGMLDKAVEHFGNAVENGYNAETAMYYKAVALNKQGKDDAYVATLKEGAEKFPDDDRLSSSLAKVYVSEANGLYKKGAAVLTAANEQVSAGTIKTTDDAYKNELSKAQDIFREAITVLEKAKEVDASNPNIKKLMDACNAVL